MSVHLETDYVGSAIVMVAVYLRLAEAGSLRAEMLRLMINLEGAVDRLAHMEAAFSRMKLDVKRVEAVDGHKLDNGTIARLTRPKSDGLPWTPAEVGCALSHRKCWQLIVDSGDRCGAVLEDDLHFSNDAAIFLRDEDWIPDAAELVKLETVLKPVVIDLAHEHGRRAGVHRLRSYHHGTGAYVISRSLAQRLIRETEVLPDLADVFMFNRLQEFAVHQLVPAICAQDLVLNRNRGVGDLVSKLEDERQALLARNKPRGLGKLKRETVRPFRQLADAACNTLLPLKGRRRVVVSLRR